MDVFDTTLLPPQKGVYLVGGSLRDALLGRKPLDIDLAVKGDPMSFARDFARRRNGRLVIMGKPGRQVIRVVLKDALWDVSPVKGDSIEEDLAARDFTINALAFDTASRRLIDISNGIHDLEQSRIRMVSPDAFEQDPLRLLRAFRLGAALGFELDPVTETRIRKDAARIHQSAAERIREELLKILSVPHALPVVRRMQATGLLFELFPELAALQGCGPSRHHQVDSLEHTLMALDALEALPSDAGSPFAGGAEPGQPDGGMHDNPLLKCSLLLHDIGKPPCQTRDGSGELHFFGHEKVGSIMAQAIGTRFRFSASEIRYVGFMVHRHLDPLQLFLARQRGTLTRRGIARFLMRCGNHTPDLLLHATADMQAKRPEPVHRDAGVFMHFIEELRHHYRHSYLPFCSGPPLITGSDLIHVLYLEPSPEFKIILSRVEEFRMAGRISTRDEALKLAKSLARDRPRRR